MELWTEYEGRTIDGAFPLTKLLRPEGRSAFFSTSNGTGVPRLIRLIEAHFDEEDILARWRRVTALDHPNILKLEAYGTAVVDETSLIYAVMEPVDGNLGEVVSRQRLTVPETRQVANSVVAAIGALHAHGFVHEHVAPSNVLAVGEVVKLRSDCIREAPEGEEGRDLKKRDVHDLAVVLLQALTQEKTLEAAAPSRPLPAPFDQIVPKGMSGEWGLVEIASALEPAVAPRNSRAAIAVDARTAPAQSSSSTVVPPPPKSKVAEVSPSADRIRVPEQADDEVRRAGPRVGLMVVIGLAAILVLWLGWYFLHARTANQNSSQQQAAASPPAANSSVTSAATASIAPANAPAARTNSAAGGHGQWRVIAYTYNQKDLAQQKTAAIAKTHPELQPEVFTPSGHAPYLVTVGGTMSRDEAFALVKKVRSEGLPSDSYAQNYRNNER